MHVLSDPQSRPYARMTGALYLTIAVAGAFAIGYVPSQLLVAGDPAASLANITARRGLFDLGIAADSVVMLVEILTTAMLFQMFRTVNETLALAAAFARLMMVAVMAAMLFFHAAALGLAEPSAGLETLAETQRTALAGLMLGVHGAGVWIWQLFFALHLVLLGQLVARSGRFPPLLGQAMTVGAFGYLLDSLHAYAFPEAGALGQLRIALLALVTLAEVGFALWLLVRGPRDAAPSGPALA